MRRVWRCEPVDCEHLGGTDIFTPLQCHSWWSCYQRAIEGIRQLRWRGWCGMEKCLMGVFCLIFAVLGLQIVICCGCTCRELWRRRKSQSVDRVEEGSKWRWSYGTWTAALHVLTIIFVLFCVYLLTFILCVLHCVCGSGGGNMMQCANIGEFALSLAVCSTSLFTKNCF